MTTDRAIDTVIAMEFVHKTQKLDAIAALRRGDDSAVIIKALLGLSDLQSVEAVMQGQQRILRSKLTQHRELRDYHRRMCESARSEVEEQSAQIASQALLVGIAQRQFADLLNHKLRVEPLIEKEFEVQEAVEVVDEEEVSAVEFELELVPMGVDLGAFCKETISPPPVTLPSLNG